MVLRIGGWLGLVAAYVAKCDERHLAPTVTRLEDYTKPNIQLSKTHMSFELGYDHTLVRADMEVTKYTGGDIILDGSDNIELEGIKIVVGNVLGPELQATYSRSIAKHVCVNGDGSLIIDEIDVPRNVPFNISIVVSTNPEKNKALSGLYRTEDALVTQNEAAGFRRIVFYPDRPDVLSVFTTTLTADPVVFPTLLSNGNFVSRTVNPRAGTHTVTYHDPFAKPSYLFALVAGKFNVVEKDVVVGRPCEEAVRFLVENTEPLMKYCTKDYGYAGPPKPRLVRTRVWGAEAKEDMLWALASIEAAMVWDEVRFGRYYDLDEFNVVSCRDFNAGAMENKGLNIFNKALIIANPAVATDADYERIQGVIAHEYFHNWSGDRVTVRDWFQLTLKEGFTVFRDQTFTSDLTESPIKRLEDITVMESLQFDQDNGPLSHPVRPASYETVENFYTVTVYEKGAEIIRMYETILGPRMFRKATDYYFARYDNSSATCESFVNAVQAVTGHDFSQFALWYNVSGTPQVQVVEQTFSQSERAFRLVIRQSTRSSKPLIIPIRIALFHYHRNATVPLLRETTLLLDDFQKIYKFMDIPVYPVVSLLRGFSAPVKVQPFLNETDLVYLAKNDNDYYQRYKAVESICMASALELSEHSIYTLSKGAWEILRTLVLEAKSARGGEAAFYAEVFSLPKISSLKTHYTPYDPLKVVNAIKTFRRLMIEEFKDDLEEIYKNLEAEEGEEYAFTSSAVGKRKLKNAVLRLLNEANGPGVKERRNNGEEIVATNSLHVREQAGLYLQMAVDQLQRARHATDEVSALRVLAGVKPRKDIEDLLNDWVYRQGVSDLMVDRWLVAQMSLLSVETVERYKRLQASHFYRDTTTPNRLRALTSSFARNPVAFNTAEGYSLVAAEIVRWDSFNAKLAASLATAFADVSLMHERYRKMALRALESVLESQPSRNVAEVVGKIVDSLERS